MKKILSMGLIIATSFLVGCGFSNNVEADNKNPFSLISGEYNYSLYKDNETGVQYIIYKMNGGCGVTLRYNADGSLYID